MNNTSQQVPPHSNQALLYCLLIINFILLAFNLPELISGAPDSYLNEHARLVSGNVAGIFIVLALLFSRRSAMRNELKGLNKNLYLLFITLSFLAVGTQFLLGM